MKSTGHMLYEDTRTRTKEPEQRYRGEELHFESSKASIAVSSNSTCFRLVDRKANAAPGFVWVPSPICFFSVTARSHDVAHVGYNTSLACHNPLKLLRGAELLYGRLTIFHDSSPERRSLLLESSVEWLHKHASRKYGSFHISLKGVSLGSSKTLPWASITETRWLWTPTAP